MRNDAADSSNPTESSAEFVVYRLVRWAINAPSGIAYVSYDSPTERTAAEARVISDVKKEGWTVERLDLSASVTISEAITKLKEKIATTEADLLSVTGFTSFLRSLSEDWTPLNFRREEWFETSTRQIWWVPSVYDAAFARRAPDLYSWFLVRERLTGSSVKIPVAETRFTRGQYDLNLALNRSKAARSRFHTAYSRKADIATLISLIMLAVRPLFEADANEEAREAFTNLLDRLEKGNRKKEWTNANSAPSVLEAKSNLASLCAQNAEPLLAERVLEDVKPGEIEGLALSDQAELHHTLGIISSYYGKHEQAEGELTRALQLYRRIPSMQGQAHSFRALGDVALRSGDWPLAKRRYEKALPLYEDSLDHLGHANILMRIGDIARSTGDVDEALRLYAMARSSYDVINHRLGLANVDVNVGLVWLVRGELDDAEATLEGAQKMFKSIGDSVGYANAVASLGKVAQHRGEDPLARRLLNEALLIYRSSCDELGEANTLAALGNCDVKAGEYGSAGEKYYNALQIYERWKQPLGTVSVLISIGDVLINVDLDRAAKTYERAYEIANLTDNILGRANASSGLAQIAVRQERPDEARVLLRAALQDYESIGNNEMIGRTHRDLADISQGEEHSVHLREAEAAWKRTGRADLAPSEADSEVSTSNL